MECAAKCPSVLEREPVTDKLWGGLNDVGKGNKKKKYKVRLNK